MTNFDNTTRAREMARWAQCLPYKHEDLHSYLQNTNKKTDSITDVSNNRYPTAGWGERQENH